jgi:DNA polymerase-3 subunit epsilon
MALAEQTFVVVDTETTGTDPVDDRIIEIGAVRIVSGRIVDQFEQLIDPERAVPRSITRLTGISNAMVSGKPTVGPAIHAFLNWVGDAPLVAHNAGFDQRFLALEGLRTGSGTFDDPFLCTLKLARRLLPGLPSKGLDSLKKFYGLSIARRHRAMDDADLTAKVLIRLMPHAEAAGAPSLDALRKLQQGNYATSGAVSKRLEKLRTGKIAEAPSVPGVYRFMDGKGKLLYVGKAKSLRERLRQYVVAVEAHPPRTRRMIAQVHDVSWEVFPTELEAMLHESRTIKSELPPHNRAQRTYRRRPFLRLLDGQVSLKTVIRRDEAEYFGPLSNSALAKVIAEILSACFGIRYTNRPGVRTPLDRERRQHVLRAVGWLEQAAADPGDLHAFLGGSVAVIGERLDEAMSMASTDFDFEAAGTLRDWKELIESRSRRGGKLAARVFDQDTVLVSSAPGRSPELTALRDGMPVAFSNSLEDLPEIILRASEWIPPGHIGEAEAEDAHVVAHWSHLHRYHLSAVERQKGEADEDFAERIRQTLSGYLNNTKDLVSV